jgi:endogenous inhibitor of DNA gyrase (YacG/DUF329 family)
MEAHMLRLFFKCPKCGKRFAIDTDREYPASCPRCEHWPISPYKSNNIGGYDRG